MPNSDEPFKRRHCGREIIFIIKCISRVAFFAAQHPRGISRRLEKDPSFEEGGAHWPVWASDLEGAMAAWRALGLGLN
ncbi:MAG: hypothetical protein WBF43_08565 [Methylocella sp.]